MTGYESKKKAAQDKLAQPAQEPWPEEPFGHMAGGVQPAQEPVATLFGTLPVYETTPALPAQEPVAWMYQCTVDNSEPVLLRKKQNWAESGTGLWVETPLSTTPPQRTEQCNYPDCKCPTENPCLKGLAQPEQEREALKLALDVLEDLPGFRADIDNAITAIKEALAQPEQEPVAWRYRGNLHEFDPSDWAEGPVTPLYTAPPQRPWVGLTEQEFQLIYDMGRTPSGMMEMVEIKLKELNHG